jgi:uroporphyrinogen-III synthase
MRRLVILRPEPGASATADRARAMGLEPVVMPLFKVEPVDWETPDAGSFDASGWCCCASRLYRRSISSRVAPPSAPSTE